MKLLRDFNNIPQTSDFQELFGLLRDNQLTILVGKNGCGKSTLLKALMGKFKQRNKSLYVPSNDRLTEAYLRLGTGSHIPVDFMSQSKRQTHFDEFAKPFELDLDNSLLNCFDSAFYISGPDNSGYGEKPCEVTMVDISITMFGVETNSNGYQSLHWADHTIKQLEAIKPKSPLILVDEMDSGVSFANLDLVKNMLLSMIYDHGAHLLLVTHNPFIMKLAPYLVDMSNNFKVTDTDKYILELTGYKLIKN